MRWVGRRCWRCACRCCWPAAAGRETAQAVPQEEIWAQVEQQLGSSLPSLMPVEEEQMEQLYGIGDDEIEDFELHMAMMNVQADEILFARVKSGQMETVKKAIEERAKQLDEAVVHLPARSARAGQKLYSGGEGGLRLLSHRHPGR